MSKWAQLGIGIAVVGLALAVIFGINHHNNCETIEALEQQATSAAAVQENGSAAEHEKESIAGPVTDGVIYVVKNGQWPGMTITDDAPEAVIQSSEAVGKASAQENVPSLDEIASEEENPGTGVFLEGEESLTWQGAVYKRNAHIKADLLIGIDNYGSADFLAVVVHDTSRNSVKLMMIPRDAMMEMNELDVEGNSRSVVTHIKFAHAGQGTENEKAMRTVDAVEALLCGTGVDHYIAGHMSYLAEVNDLAGGIAVIVPNEELQKADPAWKKGEQVVLHGAEAEKFIRYRDIALAGTPLLRMDQHKAYIAGFFNRLKEDKNLAVRLSDFAERNLTTDMSKGEYEKLLLDGISSGFDPQKDVMIFPGRMTAGKEGGNTFDQYYVNYEEAIPLLIDLFYRRVS